MSCRPTIEFESIRGEAEVTETAKRARVMRVGFFIKKRVFKRGSCLIFPVAQCFSLSPTKSIDRDCPTELIRENAIVADKLKTYSAESRPMFGNANPDEMI